MHTSRETKSYINEVSYRIDVNSLSREEGQPLSLNEIGRVSITTRTPLFVDPYGKNRSTGNFIVIDEETFHTVAGGMIIDRQPQEVFHQASDEGTAQSPRSQFIHREDSVIDRTAREEAFGHKAVTVWCTGLSGSGKSTIAKALEDKLFQDKRPVYRLDGDNLRFGLNNNLGFSKDDRRENIRRAAEVAKLFNDAGITVICSLISPMAIDRARAKEIIGADSFIEVFLSTPLAECEKRDPHGLYRKARAGEIEGFTGISSPYEAPESADIEIDTSVCSVEVAVELLVREMVSKK